MTAAAVMRWGALILGVARRYSLPPEVVAGLVEQESAGNPFAMRFEPRWAWFWPPGGILKPPAGVSVETERAQQMTSWGLMQVMGAVCRQLKCAEPFLGKLGADPELALDLGCQYLRQMIGRYGTVERGLSAYNAGSPSGEGSEQWRQYVVSIMARTAGYRKALAALP